MVVINAGVKPIYPDLLTHKIDLPLLRQGHVAETFSQTTGSVNLDHISKPANSIYTETRSWRYQAKRMQVEPSPAQ